MLKDKFLSEIESDPLMMSHDVVGYWERVIEQTKNEFHDIIYQMLTPRLADDIKSKIENDGIYQWIIIHYWRETVDVK